MVLLQSLLPLPCTLHAGVLLLQWMLRAFHHDLPLIWSLSGQCLLPGLLRIPGDPDPCLGCYSAFLLRLGAQAGAQQAI